MIARGGEKWEALNWKTMPSEELTLPDAMGESVFFGLEVVDGSEVAGLQERASQRASAKAKAGAGAEGKKAPKKEGRKGGAAAAREAPAPAPAATAGEGGRPESGEAAGKKAKRKRPDKRARARMRRREEKAAAAARHGGSATAGHSSEDAASAGDEGSPPPAAASAATEALPPAWASMGIDFHPTIVRGLVKAGFASPTPIQAAVLPPAVLYRKNIVGAAQTGSGKTLAFGLPMVQALLAAKAAGEVFAGLPALVLAPTRELAMQVTKHLQAICGAGGHGAGLSVVNVVGGMAEVKQLRLLAKEPEIVVATPGRFWEMVRSGRAPHIARLGRLRFLVVDEADRMVETGRFRELKALLGRVHAQEEEERLGAREKQRRHAARKRKEQEWIIHDTGKSFVEGEVLDSETGEALPGYGDEDVGGLLGPAEFDVEMLDERVASALEGDASGQLRLDAVPGKADYEKALATGTDGAGSDGSDGSGASDGPDDDAASDDGAGGSILRDEDGTVFLPPPPPRQTFVFSATLAALGDERRGKRGKAKGGDDGGESVLAVVLPKAPRARAKDKANRPFVVDLTAGKAEPSEASEEAAAENRLSQRLPSTLTLSEMRCLQQQKDTHAYYFLSQFEGRILVFVNAVAQSRRLTMLLKSLNLRARSLHAQMQQRQRLKALDAFRREKNSILVATDVAARGLDIPEVRVVFHFDIPSSPQTFVHRAGRTARAMRHGISVSLVSPMDEPKHLRIIEALRPQADDAEARLFDAFPIDDRKLDGAKERVGLARRITTRRLKAERIASENGWLRQQAKDADMDIDEDLADGQDARADFHLSNSHVDVQDEERLRELLARPLFERRRSFIDVAQLQRDGQQRAAIGASSGIDGGARAGPGTEDDGDSVDEDDEDGEDDLDAQISAAADAVVAARMAKRPRRA